MAIFTGVHYKVFATCDNPTLKLDAATLSRSLQGGADLLALYNPTHHFVEKRAN